MTGMSATCGGIGDFESLDAALEHGGGGFGYHRVALGL